MCRPDGKPLARTHDVGKLAVRMDALSDIYNNSERKSDVAVYMSQQINHLMEGDKMTDNYLNGLVGTNYLLQDLHINSDFISEKEIVKGSLKKYKVLILPCTYIISENCAEAIKDFVNGGGTVIADYILAEKRPGGLCYTSLPGAGLDTVFGIEREDVLYIAHPVMERENPLGIAVGSMIEQVIPTTAKAVEKEYMPGFPMMTENSFGKGKAIYIPTQYFSKYVGRPSEDYRNVLKNILSKNEILPYCSLAAEDKKERTALITSSLQDKDGELKMVVVTKTNYEDVTDTLVLPKGSYEFVEQNERFKIVSDNENTKVEFTLTAMESLAIFKKD
jgi:hypothetical protein